MASSVSQWTQDGGLCSKTGSMFCFSKSNIPHLQQQIIKNGEKVLKENGARKQAGIAILMSTNRL